MRIDVHAANRVFHEVSLNGGPFCHASAASAGVVVMRMRVLGDVAVPRGLVLILHVGFPRSVEMTP